MPKKTKVENKITFRPPIVAVLGHVDHGKTTLLDTIRKSNVAKKETGGITQHIGAYQVDVDTKEGKKKITFIDTPGHETFSKIRSRGTEAADIAILVIAVNDNIQPQTIESIELIKQAKIPFIVAVTKIDIDKNIEPVKKKLKKYGVDVEGKGGETVCLGISSKTNEGIKDLLEMIILISEMQGLKNEPNDSLEAIIIDSKIDKNKGVELGLIVKKGTLKKGQDIYSETQQARVRAIFDDHGLMIDQAGPSTPCQLLGFTKPVLVGEKILEIEPAAVIKTIPPEEKETEEAGLEQKPIEKVLKIILKADCNNSLEAILMSLPQDGLHIIQTGLGDISEADVFFAKTTHSFLIGFNIEPSNRAVKLAQSERVKIKTFKIIYELLEEIKEVIKAFTEEKLQDILGKAMVVAEFPYDNKRVAGVKVTEGRLARGDVILLTKEDKTIKRGVIKSMKKYKQEVNKTEVGEECGIIIDPNIDFHIGDMLVSVQS